MLETWTLAQSWTQWTEGPPGAQEDLLQGAWWRRQCGNRELNTPLIPPLGANDSSRMKLSEGFWGHVQEAAPSLSFWIVQRTGQLDGSFLKAIPKGRVRPSGGDYRKPGAPCGCSCCRAEASLDPFGYCIPSVE